MFRKRLLFSQVCIPLDRFVKLHDDKGTTDKKQLLFAAMQYEKSFSALAQAGFCTHLSLFLLS